MMILSSRLNGIVALSGVLLGCVLPASARPFRVWNANELAEKADVIVMATVFSNRDARDFSRETHKPDDLVPVVTTFGVDAVLKGKLPGKIDSREGMQIEVTHNRYFDPMSKITIIDGAFLTEFDAKKHSHYLMFLHKEASGKLTPLTGGYDDFLSFVSLGDYIGSAKAKLPAAPNKTQTPKTQIPPAQAAPRKPEPHRNAT